MNQIDKLYNEYNEIKENLLKNNSLNNKEDLKNKLIELDYEKTKEYSEEIDKKFPMTTTLEKEEVRLANLISFIQKKIGEQKDLVNDYKKLTGTTIELSYLKGSDRLLDYKKRLENVKRYLSIRNDLKKLIDSKDEKNDVKIKVLKNRLMKKEILNLLYEFCLIDSLEINDIDVDKLLEGQKQDIEVPKEALKPKKEIKVVKSKTVKPKELPKKVDEIKDVNEKDDKKVEKNKNEELKPEIIIPPVVPVQVPKIEEVKVEVINSEEKKEEAKKEEKQEIKEEDKVSVQKIEQPVEQPEEKIMTSMPIVDKIGSVVPVNVFESLQKTEEKIPDVILPSNGLKDDQNDIFVNTKELFEENEKK